MERKNIYFFHIPKTAGVSVWRFLENSFPPTQICPWWLWDQLVSVPHVELDQWHVFRGHFMSHLEPYLGRPLTTFTMLRDPVERTISHYCHVRRAPDHPYYGYAQRLSLAEFCVHPETRHMIENFQATYLAKPPGDPMKDARGLSTEQLACFELQRQLERAGGLTDPIKLLEIAKERLRGFSAVGFTEDFDVSLREISYRLGCREPPSLEAQNVNPERTPITDLDEATLALIRNLTAVDQRLYEYARVQFASH